MLKNWLVQMQRVEHRKKRRDRDRCREVLGFGILENDGSRGMSVISKYQCRQAIPLRLLSVLHIKKRMKNYQVYFTCFISI